ncbi:MAG: tol-pal system YbgF family protein [Elusimicrobiota bacterium]
MKTLLLLAVFAAPLAAQEAAPSAPAAEVKDLAAPAPGSAPAPAEAKALTAPPSEETKVSAQKAADSVPAKPAEPVKVEEKKPEPAKVEAPKAEEPKVVVESPKLEGTKPLPPVAKKAAAKPVAAAKVVGPDDEWLFAKSAAEDADSAVQDAAVDELRLFVRRHPDASQAPDALFLIAGLRAKKDWQLAAASLLRLIYEYNGSEAELRAKSTYLELIGNKASRKQRSALNDLVNVPDTDDKADRLSALWARVAEKAPDALYEPVADEIRDFLVRFPDHKDNDKLQAALARLHAANDKSAAAVLAWRKLLALYPESALRPQAQMAIGDLHADALRDPKKAIDAYQQVIASYPDAPEVLGALESSARLFEEKLKQYDLSVEMDEKIVKLFPKTAGSLKALKGMARLQRDRLSKSDEAIKTLQRLSAMHGGQDGVDALLLGADIARRDLKDYGREAALRIQVSTDYQAAKEAPQALYDAAGVYEDDVKDAAKAIETYKLVATKYPTHKLAKKGTDRAAKLAAAK